MAQTPKIIVGMAGGTASGKSTLARSLAESLGENCLLINHDRYYFDVANPVGHNYDAPEELDNALLIEHIKLLKTGQSAPLPVYDFKTHSRSKEVEISTPTPVVIVEGILVLAIPELRSLFGLTVFVEASESVRLERRIHRDLKKRGRTRDSVMAQYRKTVQPMHDVHVQPSATGVDLTLSGEGPIQEAKTSLITAIQPYFSAG